ncbi:interferon a3-like [Leuresthes tenuis]|uniref:interferon a3-like n=1 Tax=Leuresthes tenuis TaxID=355514 RepID=UPI003B50FE80
MFSHTGPLLALCSVLTSALCCDWLTEYSDLRNSSVTLVELMGGAFTDQESPVPFPYKLYAQVEKKGLESQLLFIRDSLEQIYLLFRSNNHSSANWDTRKTTQFLESLHRQVVELSSCVPKKRTDSRLRNYYRRLKNSTLSCPGGSAASWELLRRETKDHLDRLDLLGNLVKASAASRGRPADSSTL